jgi:hypothetical protein
MGDALLYFLVIGPQAAFLFFVMKRSLQRLFSDELILGSRLVNSFQMLVIIGLSLAYAGLIVTGVLAGIGLEQDAKERQATTRESLFGG